MSKRRIPWVRGVLLGCMTGLAAAAWAQSDAAERDRIRRERADVEAAFAAQERDCQERFAVTACVDDARRSRRSALAELRRQVTVLDEEQRRQRAERRRQLIQENLAREAAEQRDAAPRPGREPLPAPAQRGSPAEREPKPVRPAPPKSPDGRGPTPKAPPSDAGRAAQEARHRARFEARQRDARAHEDEVRARNEAAAAKRQPAASLPVPEVLKP